MQEAVSSTFSGPRWRIGRTFGEFDLGKENCTCTHSESSVEKWGGGLPQKKFFLLSGLIVYGLHLQVYTIFSILVPSLRGYIGPPQLIRKYDVFKFMIARLL